MCLSLVAQKPSPIFDLPPAFVEEDLVVVSPCYC